MIKDTANNAMMMTQGATSMVRMSHLGMEAQSVRLRRQTGHLRAIGPLQIFMPHAAARPREIILSAVGAIINVPEDIMEKMALMAEFGDVPETARGLFSIDAGSDAGDARQPEAGPALQRRAD